MPPRPNESGPEPPAGAPKYLIEGFQKQTPGTLRDLAQYAIELADAAEREAEEEAEQRREAAPDLEAFDDLDGSDRPTSGAYVTTKTIDGNDYLYWQWRDGDSWENKYIRPKNPKRD